MTRTAGARIGCQRPSRFWGLGRPKIYHEAEDTLEIWFNAATDKYTTIPNHPGDMPEGTLRAILRQAEVMAEALLNA
ncbi:type II toxin-antitoxin system HicA family toxin [Thiolapillus sp.]|uniref:type II toxin-antitoxin system HicA family toxin n=1 Tax=Thiolapillus sp. TaxID=2017437 RepID=UPI0027E554DB|nr:type II toxin-antitoxin system HicA family toxin [Thiolapillus sp.]